MVAVTICRMITHQRLLEVLHYDPTTGIFTWRVNYSRRYLAGREAGTLMAARKFTTRNGQSLPYWTISVDGKTYFRHRLAVFYMTGIWPKDLVDHIDRDSLNDKYVNLREATRSQNQANTGTYRSNRLRRKGVYVVNPNAARPFRAMIQKDNRRISLGRFRTVDEAHAAYAKAAADLHGEFARFA